MPAQTVIKVRRGTSAEWDASNPILAPGEMGLETDTNSFKFGNGSDSWANLPFAGGSQFTGSVDWNNVLSKPTVAISGDDIDGGGADVWYTWKDLRVDNGDATTVILDGSYLDGGSVVFQ